MALPSSPPLLPELPTLPSSPPALVLPNRKRHLADYDSSLSSDPLFSEDPSEAEDKTTFERPRRKRMVKGPWWLASRSGKETQSSDAAIEGKDGQRSFDSGVWMGSDNSEASLDSIVCDQTKLRELSVHDLPGCVTGKKVQIQEQPVVQQIVEGCVEVGKEVIDLSDLGLESLSDETVKPLHQLIRQTHTHLTHPPSEDEFASFTPSIQLFLSRNRLSSLPSELFQLANITVLSLRNNALLEIPPMVGRLSRLKELNVAGNDIRCLPWELFSFFDCRGEHKQLHIRPNPLFEPTKISGRFELQGVQAKADKGGLSRYGDPTEYIDDLRQALSQEGHVDMRSELELRLRLGRLLRHQHIQEASRDGTELNLCKEELIYLASSEIQYLDVDGVPMQKLQTNDETFTAVIDQARGPPASPASTCAPSLLELILRHAQKLFYLDDFPPSMHPRMQSALRAAGQALERGQKCATCGVAFVIPRSQWVEYWFNGLSSQADLTQETVLPFMKRACSWMCARPTEIGTFKC